MEEGGGRGPVFTRHTWKVRTDQDPGGGRWRTRERKGYR